MLHVCVNVRKAAVFKAKQRVLAGTIVRQSPFASDVLRMNDAAICLRLVDHVQRYDRLNKSKSNIKKIG
jgi:hypothetical protein